MSKRSDEIAAAVARLGALGQTTRLSVVRHLLKAHPDGMNAGDIARRCDVAHNTLSAHLNVLTNSGLLIVERRGREMNYRMDLTRYRSLLKFLAKDCGDDLQVPANEVEDASVTERFMMPAFNVLFLCTHNSA